MQKEEENHRHWPLEDKLKLVGEGHDMLPQQGTTIIIIPSLTQYIFNSINSVPMRRNQPHQCLTRLSIPSLKCLVTDPRKSGMKKEAEVKGKKLPNWAPRLSYYDTATVAMQIISTSFSIHAIVAGSWPPPGRFQKLHQRPGSDSVAPSKLMSLKVARMNLQTAILMRIVCYDEEGLWYNINSSICLLPP